MVKQRSGWINLVKFIQDVFGVQFGVSSGVQGKFIVKFLKGDQGVIVNIDIVQEGKQYGKITVTKGFLICCGIVGNNLRSRDFVLIEVLGEFIEWDNKRGGRGCRIVFQWTPQPGPKPGFSDGVCGFRGGLVGIQSFQIFCTQN